MLFEDGKYMLLLVYRILGKYQPISASCSLSPAASSSNWLIFAASSLPVSLGSAAFLPLPFFVAGAAGAMFDTGEFERAPWPLM